MPDDLIAFSEAAALLGVSQRTLERRIRAAVDFPRPERCGGWQRVFRRSVIEQWLDEQQRRHAGTRDLHRLLFDPRP